MSGVEDKEELKGGHPPAVKAGGMRIAKHRKISGSEKTVAEDEEEFADPQPTKGEVHNQQALIAGVMTKGDKDFPADAVRQFHDKPHASKEKPRANPGAHRIQQPR